MLIRRSELDGTRVLEIDRLVQRGARGPSGRSVRFLTDPDDAQVVLHSPAFDRQRLARSFVGDGILFSDGDHWRERRRLIQPAYPPREPDHHLEDIRWAIPGLVARVEEAAAAGTPLGVVDETVRYTTRILYRSGFGQDLPEDHDRVRVIIDYFDAIGGVLSSTIFPGMGLDADVMASVRRAQAAMTEEVDRLVAARRALGRLDRAEDALGRIAAAMGDDDDGIRDEVRSLLVAGAETTSNVLGFLLLLLADHPGIQDRLLAAFESTPDEDPVLLDAVVMEALRLFPPVWFQAREAREAIEVGGGVVGKDDLVFVATALIQRRPDLWPGPDRFDPDRFLAEDGSLRRPTHRYAYLPFGGGRHLCIGRHLALHELREAIRALVPRFRFESTADATTVELGVVLKPARDARVRAVLRKVGDS